MIKIDKRYIGLPVFVWWKDPEEHTSELYTDVLKKPFAIHKANGVLKHVDSTVVILEHDLHDDGNSGDYTTIVPQLITAFEVIKSRKRLGR